MFLSTLIGTKLRKATFLYKENVGVREQVQKRVCANCRNNYIEGDKYCRYCGAPMGKPVFIEEDFALIYGPEPIKRIHTCGKCGYSWNTQLMLDYEQFCPMCGGNAPAIDNCRFQPESPHLPKILIQVDGDI